MVIEDGRQRLRRRAGRLVDTHAQLSGWSVEGAIDDLADWVGPTAEQRHEAVTLGPGLAHAHLGDRFMRAVGQQAQEPLRAAIERSAIDGDGWAGQNIYP